MEDAASPPDSRCSLSELVKELQTLGFRGSVSSANVLDLPCLLGLPAIWNRTSDLGDDDRATAAANLIKKAVERFDTESQPSLRLVAKALLGLNMPRPGMGVVDRYRQLGLKKSYYENNRRKALHMLAECLMDPPGGIPSREGETSSSGYGILSWDGAVSAYGRLFDSLRHLVAGLDEALAVNPQRSVNAPPADSRKWRRRFPELNSQARTETQKVEFQEPVFEDAAGRAVYWFLHFQMLREGMEEWPREAYDRSSMSDVKFPDWQPFARSISGPYSRSELLSLQELVRSIEGSQSPYVAEYMFDGNPLRVEFLSRLSEAGTWADLNEKWIDWLEGCARSSCSPDLPCPGHETLAAATVFLEALGPSWRSVLQRAKHAGADIPAIWKWDEVKRLIRNFRA
jgi:hypothetical protein